MNGPHLPEPSDGGASGPIRVALYGGNGHQIYNLPAGHPAARIAAVAELRPEQLPPALRESKSLTYHPTLEALLSDPEIDLVSLCSPRRADQARHAILCLEAGKHVYAEKPCALTEAEMDEILAASERTGRQFREMSDTAFGQPYAAMRAVVESGILGTVVQVFAQKSYPYHDRRPQDEETDGGLTAQVGVHALRMIELVARQRITKVVAWETRLGNPVVGGNLRMATSLVLRLESGGVASVVLNYLNPKGSGHWGNETLRVFGTEGFVETTDGGRRTRLVVGDRDHGALDVSAPVASHFDCYVAYLRGDAAAMPFSLEEELHPTRLVIRARENAFTL